MLGALAIGLASVPSPARAHEFYVFRVPNTAWAANPVGTRRACITCHDNADGGSGCVAGGGTAPCLNPFGEDFADASFTWIPSLAAIDSDADGFSNGHELQEPSGAWTVVMDRPGVADYVTRPGSALDHPGLTDADRDGYCWYGRDLDGDGTCTSPGEITSEGDCRDDDPAVHSGATELCTNDIDDDCNGQSTLTDPACRSVVDRDGDGYCPTGEDLDGDGGCFGPREATEASDCDDAEPTVSPAAGEHCGDGLDNDCDGRVDAADSVCTGDSDADGDGYCPIGRDVNGDGDCLDAGEPSGGFDCDDGDASASPGNVEVCGNGGDDDCDGRADFRDPECVDVFDGDGDGVCPTGRDIDGDAYCTTSAEADGSIDCDDRDPARHSGARELCTNRIDEDCDGHVDLADSPDCDDHRDLDGDRWCGVGFDFNRDGTCSSEGEIGGGVDCDESRVEVMPEATEICTDGLDNDCNGISDGWDPTCAEEHLDFDHDGWCAVGEDLNGDGDCSDGGEQTGPSDAAPRDSTVSPGAFENCLDGKDNDQDGAVDREDPDCTDAHDADGDGFCPIGQDLDGDGACAGPGENRAVTDCHDGDPEIGPGATEGCADWIDDDCDGDVDLLDTDCYWALDRDGDGFCGTGIDDTRDGDCLDEAERRFGADCDDTDRAVNPRAVEVCDDGMDNDCDGETDAHDTACPCTSAEQCDDGDPCTMDGCSADGQSCEHAVSSMCGDAGEPAPPPDGAGCGCRSTPNRGIGGWLVLLAAIVLHRRRQRRHLVAKRSSHDR